MSEYFQEKRRTHLIYWVTGLMLKGAGWAAAFVIGTALVLGVLYGVSLLLPPESKEAPSPYGALELPLTTRIA